MQPPEPSAAPSPESLSAERLWDEDSINSDPTVLARLPHRLRAAERLRERLSGVPFYAKGAAAAKAAGNEMGYWLNLQGSQGAIGMPSRASSAEMLTPAVEALRQDAIKLNALAAAAFRKTPQA